ncbi:MAG: N-acetylmuramoyl-L-alanine amidase [Gemmatimonadales bacterium]|nr:N-acetylmuramoyl-L-alanine amidase [Gemmatimonadales bacterium]
MMIAGILLAALVLPKAPMTVVIQTVRGEARVPVRWDQSFGPVLPAPQLLAALGAEARIGAGWAEVTVGPQVFRFLLGAPLYQLDGTLRPLAGSASLRRDTLELPIQFVSEMLPRAFGRRFRYDARAARLVDNAPAPAAALAAAKPAADPNRLPNGLRKGHVVTIDAGHGGVDPGNPGIFFPNGLKEKDVTLQLSRLLRDELRERGVKVVMTRARDTLIDIRDRGAYCTEECDLFLSIHVNSLPKRPGYTRVRGFETYYLAEAKTEDAARVARMENEAIRFEDPKNAEEQLNGLDFIMKDLQLNEHLREAVRAAELVQSYLQESHTGPDKGVKQGNLIVLNTARRPAILVEVGFSTNPEDAKLMTTRASQLNLVSSLADAVVAYLLEYERKVGQGAATSAGARAGQK